MKIIQFLVVLLSVGFLVSSVSAASASDLMPFFGNKANWRYDYKFKAAGEVKVPQQLELAVDFNCNLQLVLKRTQKLVGEQETVTGQKEKLVLVSLQIKELVLKNDGLRLTVGVFDNSPPIHLLQNGEGVYFISAEQEVKTIEDAVLAEKSLILSNTLLEQKKSVVDEAENESPEWEITNQQAEVKTPQARFKDCLEIKVLNPKIFEDSNFFALQGIDTFKRANDIRLWLAPQVGLVKLVVEVKDLIPVEGVEGQPAAGKLKLDEVIILEKFSSW